MGLKENFSQAVRELTGAGRDEKKTDAKSTVDGMRSAVAAEDTSEFMAVNEATAASGVADSFEEIERRAAMAAENLSRKQDAFNQTEFSGAPESIPVTDPDQTIKMAQTQQFTMPNQLEFTETQQNINNVPPQPPNFNTQANQTQQSFNNYQGFGGGQTPPPAPPVNSFSTASYGRSDDNEITVISKNTVIDGNVRSFANMSIDGNIKGNVETTKDIDLNGKIVGDIACNNASLRTSQIQGNVKMKGNAFMERDTLLIGDLSSTYANVNGKVKGNLAIAGKAEFKSDAVVFGDISASTITVNDGAIIQGYVSTTFLNKEESKNIFPDTINIGE